ncbi:MAG: YwaF family protein [Clostridia bacterium]|nr:YwaF family protein [Clostridia bacterium]
MKFFYDHYTEDQVGAFTWQHFLIMGIFVIAMVVAVYFSRKLNEKQTSKVLLSIAILVTVMEVIKITIRIIKGSGLDGFFPLYFCSLFIYSIWLTFCKNDFLKTMGFSFIIFGGIIGSIINTVYPTTSLMMYPAWHPSTLHSFFYHWLMLYTAILVIMKKLYQPKAKHFLHFFVLMTVASIIAFIINITCGSNMMFIGNPYGLPAFVKSIYEVSPYLFAFLSYFVQTFLLYWACFGIYKLVEYIILRVKTKNENKKNELA